MSVKRIMLKEIAIVNSFVDYCEYFLRKAPFLLFGGDGEGAGPRLQKFWEAFRNRHPTHQVYQLHANDLDRCIPYLFHGDEGKGPKRATFMDFSFETPFGLDLRSSRDTVSKSFSAAVARSYSNQIVVNTLKML